MEELAVDAGTQAFLDEKAHAIRARLKRTAEDVIAIGLDLIAVKERVGYGRFRDWIETEFEMERQTAQNFMNVARRFDGKLPTVGHLPLKVLYEVSTAPTPDALVDAVISGDIPADLDAIRAAKARLEQPYTPMASLPRDEIEVPEPTWAAISSDEDADRAFARYLQQQSRAAKDVADRLGITGRERVGVPAALQSSDSNEWYTPGQYTDAARELMGAIDLDPASNIQANTIVQARTFYSIEDDGFTKPWHGRVFLNPPYGFQDGKSNQERWSQRLLAQYADGITTEAVLLVNANTEAKWFHPLYDYLICLTDHRIRFYNTQDEASQPTQGNAFVYLGNQRARFIEIFSRFGVVIERAQ